MDNFSEWRLTRKRKGMLLGLSVFSIAVAILFVVQFKKSVKSPFTYTPTAAELEQAAANTATTTDLTTVDTDQDGLSDYEELYVYGTSPYLSDSDSDGKSDYEEIKVTKTDPNCPTGKDCDLSSFVIATSTTITETPATVADTDLEGLMSGASDPATLRKLLLDSGAIDATALNAISDADLLKMYQQMLADQSNQ